MKKQIFTLAVALVAGFAVGIAQADDEKGKGKKTGGKGDPAKRAEMLLKKCDKDADEKLSKDEFAASPIAKRMNEKKGDGASDKVFGRMDKNKDGFLDKAELSAAPKGKGKGKGKDTGKPAAEKKDDAGAEKKKEDKKAE